MSLRLRLRVEASPAASLPRAVSLALPFKNVFRMLQSLGILIRVMTAPDLHGGAVLDRAFFYKFDSNFSSKSLRDHHDVCYLDEETTSHNRKQQSGDLIIVRQIG